MNIFSSGIGTYSAFLEDQDQFTETLPVTLSVVAATPEPSSLALLGTGVLGAAGAIARRRKAIAV